MNITLIMIILYQCCNMVTGKHKQKFVLIQELAEINKMLQHSYNIIIIKINIHGYIWSFLKGDFLSLNCLESFPQYLKVGGCVYDARCVKCIQMSVKRQRGLLCRQLLYRSHEVEVRREQLVGFGVHQLVGLSDGHLSHSCDVSYIWKPNIGV